MNRKGFNTDEILFISICVLLNSVCEYFSNSVLSNRAVFSPYLSNSTLSNAFLSLFQLFQRNTLVDSVRIWRGRLLRSSFPKESHDTFHENLGAVEGEE